MKRDVGVVTPTHPGRNFNGHLARAASSVATQVEQPQMHCIFNDIDRRGAAYARQRALDMNTAHWTAFLDSDDWFLPNHLQILLNAAEETGADYVYAWYFLAYGPERVMAAPYDPVFPPGHCSLPWNPNEPRQTTITVLVRTDLAKDIGFWDVTDAETFEDGKRKGEDYMFTLACNELGKIHHIPDVRTWVWNHHGQNTSGLAGQGDAR